MVIQEKGDIPFRPHCQLWLTSHPFGTGLYCISALKEKCSTGLTPCVQSVFFFFGNSSRRVTLQPIIHNNCITKGNFCQWVRGRFRCRIKRDFFVEIKQKTERDDSRRRYRFWDKGSGLVCGVHRACTLVTPSARVHILCAERTEGYGLLLKASRRLCKANPPPFSEGDGKRVL